MNVTVSCGRCNTTHYNEGVHGPYSPPTDVARAARNALTDGWANFDGLLLCHKCKYEGMAIICAQCGNACTEAKYFTTENAEAAASRNGARRSLTTGRLICGGCVRKNLIDDLHAAAGKPPGTAIICDRCGKKGPVRDTEDEARAALPGTWFKLERFDLCQDCNRLVHEYRSIGNQESYKEWPAQVRFRELEDAKEEEKASVERLKNSPLNGPKRRIEFD